MDRSIQEIIDYCKCPMFYKIKYIHPELITEQISMFDKYDSDIHKVIYFSMNRVSENSTIRIEDIKAAWGRAWVKDKRRVDLIFADTASYGDTYNERRMKGLNALIKFRKTFNDMHLFPMIINKSYRININKDLYLTGSFETVAEVTLEDKTKVIQNFAFRTNEHCNSLVNYKFDMKMMASSIALKNTIDIEFENYIYNVDANRMIQYKMQNLDDITFRKNIYRVHTAINNNIFYVCPSDKCFSCIYNNICRNVNNVRRLMK